MSNESITAAITHAASAAGLVDQALSDLASAAHKLSCAAEALKSANAYVSDGNSESTATRLSAVKFHMGGTHLVTEVLGIYESLTDHLSSLRGELETPGSQF